MIQPRLVTRGHRLFAFFHLAAYTGGRRGELLNLRWRDVDLAGAEIRISGSAAVVGGTRIEGTTKSRRSRTVSIDAGTVRVLKEHRARQAEELLTAGPEWIGDDDYVFTTAWGGPVHPDTVSSLIGDLVRAHNVTVGEAGGGEVLPNARLHDLRHVHATTFCEGRSGSGHHGGARARGDRHHDEHLRARPAGASPGGGRRHGRAVRSVK